MRAVHQHYQLLKLLQKSGPALDFSGKMVLFFPLSLDAAALYEQTNEGFLKGFSLPAMKNFPATEIQYRLTAWNESVMGQEIFRHPVEHCVLFGVDRFSRPKKSPRLFMRMTLNRILDTSDFPGASGVQFIC